MYLDRIPYCTSMKTYVEEAMKRVAWFSKIDYEIMGFFEEFDLKMSPKVLAANLEYHPSYMGRRLRTLRDVGLLQQHEDGLYSLSDLGEEFLAAELSQTDIEALDPDSE